ncbi:MAG: hypothetical protein B5M51_00495 [Anaerolinea sp. 4484_236]|nr:MAG: hypothetical protein B5M51_00495 [Anaerolinea sp. 4484_236]
MSENDLRELHPELISRRGEGTAWVLTIAVSVAMALLYWQLETIPLAAWVFWGFLLFSGFSTSLGNWMDRKTVMRVDVDGVTFENGLRKVRLGWREIQKVNVLPVRWGKSVQVIGKDAHFAFRTLAEIQFQGEARGRLGFVQGQEALEQILKSSGLTLQKEEKGAYYYARA